MFDVKSFDKLFSWGGDNDAGPNFCVGTAG